MTCVGHGFESIQSEHDGKQALVRSELSIEILADEYNALRILCRVPCRVVTAKTSQKCTMTYTKNKLV